MITGPLRSTVDRTWDEFWSGGISNPLEVPEQITNLLFIRRIDDKQTNVERKARRTGRPIKGATFRGSRYSLILANPPVGGSLDYESTSKELQRIAKTKKTELLFPLFLRLLKPDRAALDCHLLAGGLDRAAATAVFRALLDDTRFTANQLSFVQLVVEQLTANGVVDAARLHESPLTDSAPQGPEQIFTETQVDDIVAILDEVRANALPTAVVA